MTPALEGKVAIVTGAAQGIGEACAKALVDEGAVVVVSDIDGAAAEAACARIGADRAIGCDVRDDSQVAGLVAETLDAHGRLHVMVPNAGIARVAPLVETSPEDWRAVTAVNLDGVFHCIRHAAPAIIAAGGGSIVAISSITGIAGYPLAAAYASAKAGVISLCRTAALELRDHGVRVNAVCPGFIETSMVKDALPDWERISGMDADALIVAAQGRFGRPEEVARLTAFLASEQASFSSGGIYTVDGGATASLL